MPDTDDTRTLPEIAADMSQWATAEPWYGVYRKAGTCDPLQVDMLVAIYRDGGSAAQALAFNEPGRFYVIAGHVDELPAYRVPGECEETGL